MLSLLARLIIAAPERVLAAVLLLTVVAAAFSATVTEHLGAAGFQDPSSLSARGMKVLTTKFGHGDMDAAGRNLVKELRRSEFVNDVESPWDGSPQSAGLISKDGTTGLVVTGITGSENDAPKQPSVSWHYPRHATLNRASPRVAFSGVPI